MKNSLSRPLIVVQFAALAAASLLASQTAQAQDTSRVLTGAVTNSWTTATFTPGNVTWSSVLPQAKKTPGSKKMGDTLTHN